MSLILPEKKKLLTTGSGGLDVEDVFKTSLWTGSGGGRLISTGIDSGEGSLVWIKNREAFSASNFLFDTVRGPLNALFSDDMSGQVNFLNSLTGFTNQGYQLGSFASVNASGNPYVGWQFRRAQGFFDTVSYTGDGTYGRFIDHNLGQKPGMIIIKNLLTSNWLVWHHGDGTLGYHQRLHLNSAGTNPLISGGFINDEVSSSSFRVLGSSIFSGSLTDVNASGAQYIAYIFAHNPAEDGIIHCGWYDGNGSDSFDGGQVINLPWVPQFIMIKCTTVNGNWFVFDTTRGITVHPLTTQSPFLSPNQNSAEGSAPVRLSESPWPTGFRVAEGTLNGYPGRTYIYMAIRAAA